MRWMMIFLMCLLQGLTPALHAHVGGTHESPPLHLHLGAADALFADCAGGTVFEGIDDIGLEVGVAVGIRAQASTSPVTESVSEDGARTQPHWALPATAPTKRSNLTVAALPDPPPTLFPPRVTSDAAPRAPPQM